MPYTAKFEESISDSRALAIEKLGEVSDEEFKIDKMIDDKIGSEQSDILDKARMEIEGKHD